jgi:Glycerophosphoryl diester phosphodiesterase family
VAKSSAFIFVIALIAFLAFQYLYSGTLNEKTAKRAGFEVIAHRGVSRPFRTDNLDSRSCTTSIIYKPKNDYIENTIASIQAAFKYGATIVEFDIRPSRDKRFGSGGYVGKNIGPAVHIGTKKSLYNLFIKHRHDGYW